MKLNDYLDAQRTARRLLQFPFDGPTRSGLVKIDIILENVVAFRSQINDLSDLTMDDAEIVQAFLRSLFI